MVDGVPKLSFKKMKTIFIWKMSKSRRLTFFPDYDADEGGTEGIPNHSISQTLSCGNMKGKMERKTKKKVLGTGVVENGGSYYHLFCVEFIEEIITALGKLGRRNKSVG